MIDFVSILAVGFVTLLGLKEFVERYYIRPYQARVCIGLEKANAELCRDRLRSFANGQRP